MEHRLDIGLYTIHETNAHFGFGPEAGFAYPIKPNMSLLLTGRYNYALSAGSVDTQNTSTRYRLRLEPRVLTEPQSDALRPSTGCRSRAEVRPGRCGQPC